MRSTNLQVTYTFTYFELLLRAEAREAGEGAAGARATPTVIEGAMPPPNIGAVHLQAPAEDTSFRCFSYLTHLVLNLRCAVFFVTLTDVQCS